MNAVAFNVDYFVALDDVEDESELAMGYSFVTNQLAQGSAPPPETKFPFDVLVLTAIEYQPSQRLFPDLVVMHVPLDDAIPSRDELRRATIAARLVAQHVRAGKRVLTTCYKGRNRSGLINGLALVELGYSSIDAVTLIQNARGENALSNTHFKEALHAHSRSLGRGSQAELG